MTQILWENLGRDGALVLWVCCIINQAMVSATCQLACIRSQSDITYFIVWIINWQTLQVSMRFLEMYVYFLFIKDIWLKWSYTECSSRPQTVFESMVKNSDTGSCCRFDSYNFCTIGSFISCFIDCREHFMYWDTRAWSLILY